MHHKKNYGPSTMDHQTDRSILHMDLDAFFVSVEQRKDKRLLGKALIIGGTGDRGVVSSCSYEARRFGVHSAMPMRLARRLCPHGIVIKGDFEAYEQCSREVTEIVREHSPLYEKASIDEFYIDLTGMDRFFGCYQYALELRNRIMKETHLPISLGLSQNKLVAKVVTNEVKPNGYMELPAQEVQAFLNPLHVQRIPMIGKQTSRRLTYLGVRQVHTLREIPLHVLERIFGKYGTLLYKSARGEDERPIVPAVERKSMSTETTFSQDSIDIEMMRARITRMVEQLAHKLRSEHKLTTCITLKLRYASFETLTRQKRIPYSSNDDILLKNALELFEQLYQKRIRIRLLGVRFSHLVSGGHQVALFQDIPRQSSLYAAIDAIKHKHGISSLIRGSGMGKYPL